MVPSVRLIVPIVPETPVTDGLAEVVVTAGHTAAHWP
jgi:hypothetical protein